MNNYTCICTNGYYGSNCQYKQLNSTIFKNSTILTNERSIQLNNLTEFSLNTTWSLIYQASRDGFSSSMFHAKCNSILGTLVVVRAGENQIFGGYTEQDWAGNGGWKYDSNAFLFSLVNSYNITVKMPVIRPEYAISTLYSYGPTFGNGHDFTINSDGSSGYSKLGQAYQLPSFLTYGTLSAQSFLAGSYYFKPIEIEVYSIIDRKLKFFHFNFSKYYLI